MAMMDDMDFMDRNGLSVSLCPFLSIKSILSIIASNFSKSHGKDGQYGLDGHEWTQCLPVSIHVHQVHIVHPCHDFLRSYIKNT